MHLPLNKVLIAGVDVDAIIGGCAGCDEQGTLYASVYDLKEENTVEMCHTCYMIATSPSTFDDEFDF